MARLFIIAMVGMSTMTAIGDEAKKLPLVEVSLGDSAKSLRGKKWPRAANGGYASSTAVDDPCRISVLFPSGLVLTSRSQTVFLRHTKGIVSKVDVMPLETPVPFANAVEALERISIGIKAKKVSRLYKAVQEWKKNPPGRDGSKDRFIRVLVEKGVALRVAVRYHKKYKGWSVLCEFTVPSLYGVSEPRE